MTLEYSSRLRNACWARFQLAEATDSRVLPLGLRGCADGGADIVSGITCRVQSVAGPIAGRLHDVMSELFALRGQVSILQHKSQEFFNHTEPLHTAIEVRVQNSIDSYQVSQTGRWVCRRGAHVFGACGVRHGRLPLGCPVFAALGGILGRFRYGGRVAGVAAVPNSPLIVADHAWGETFCRALQED